MASRSPFAVLPTVLLLFACAGVSVKNGEVNKDRTRYHFGDPGPQWRRVALEDVDVTWVRDATAHTLSVDATCRDYGDVPLQALLRQQLIGFTAAERLDQREEMVDGRAALFTRWRAKLDGVPVELGLWTLKKDSCIYDFTYTSPAGAYDVEAGSLAKVVAGFHTERVQ